MNDNEFVPEEDDEYPDFASLYRPYYDPEAKSHLGVSPRMAFRLWLAANEVADSWHQALTDDHHRQFVIEDLPVVAQPFAHGQWLQDFALRIALVRDSLSNGLLIDERYASCTADEVALQLVIGLAEGIDSEMWPFEEAESALPAYPDLDNDFEFTRDMLLQDEDVLLLYDPAHDGVENDHSRSTRYVNLHPRDWFKRFD